MLITWGLSAIGALQAFNGAFYDLTTRYAPGRSLQSDQVLVVVGTPRDYQSHREPWLQTLQVLQNLGAKQIIFGFVPDQASTAFFLAAQDAGQVIFGRPVQHRVVGSRLKSWPDAARTFELPFGVAGIPPAELGIHRKQSTFYSVEGQRYPTLELTAARNALSNRASLPSGPFLVNFRSAIPVVTLQHVLNDDLNAELVRDRNILIGIRPDEPAPGLHVPTSASSGSMPLPVFQGYALDSLLEKRWISELPDWVTLVLILVIAAMGVIIYQRAESKFGTWLTVAIVLIYLDLAWLLPGYAFSWPPVAEMVVAQLVTFLLVMQNKTQVKEQVLQQMLLGTNARLEERLAPPSLYTEDEPWPQLISLVQPILDPDRMMFLETTPGKSSVQTKAGFSCDANDIFEQRDDRRREPYSTTIAEDKAILLKWPYLKPRPREDQFLAPLNFADELLGFWAIGIKSDKIKAMPHFRNVIDDLSAEIAQRLYHRRQWLAQWGAEQTAVKRYLRLEGSEPIYKPLKQTVNQLMRRTETQERVFDDLSIGIVFYDLFGEVVQVNRHMTELLSKSGLQSNNTTSIELLSTLSGQGKAYARSTLRNVIMSQKPINLSVSMPNQDSRFVLGIRPLSQSRELDPMYADLIPSRLSGVIFELTERTEQSPQA